MAEMQGYTAREPAQPQRTMRAAAGATQRNSKEMS
jgi:hypothetical protein